MCFNEEEIPNILLPIINKTGIIRPMRGPEIYQGQGCVKTFMFLTLKKFYSEFQHKLKDYNRSNQVNVIKSINTIALIDY